MSTETAKPPESVPPDSKSVVTVGELRLWEMGAVLTRLTSIMDRQTAIIEKMDDKVDRLVILEEERQKSFWRTIWGDVKAMALKAMEPDTSGALTKLIGVLVVGIVVLAALAVNIPINIWGVVVGSTHVTAPVPTP